MIFTIYAKHLISLRNFIKIGRTYEIKQDSMYVLYFSKKLINNFKRENQGSYKI